MQESEGFLVPEWQQGGRPFKRGRWISWSTKPRSSMSDRSETAPLSKPFFVKDKLSMGEAEALSQ